MSADPLLVETLRAALVRGPRLRLAALFGSAARGARRPDSDVDVAILPEDLALPLAAELRLQVDLSLACRREVDLVRLDRASTVLKWQILQHGEPLFEAGPFSWSRFVAAAAVEYLDFAPALRWAQERLRRSLIAAREEQK